MSGMCVKVYIHRGYSYLVHKIILKKFEIYSLGTPLFWFNGQVSDADFFHPSQWCPEREGTSTEPGGLKYH